MDQPEAGPYRSVYHRYVQPMILHPEMKKRGKKHSTYTEFGGFGTGLLSLLATGAGRKRDDVDGVLFPNGSVRIEWKGRLLWERVVVCTRLSGQTPREGINAIERKTNNCGLNDLHLVSGRRER